MRNLLLLIISTALLLVSCNTFKATSDPQPPNIIYIMLDEWGYFEWSEMGHPLLKTPNIDKLANDGMRFTQFLAGASLCAPTRSTLMTGLHTGHTTVRTNGGGNALRADDLTVAQVLKRAGYATGGFGKWGLGDAGSTGVPENHGFDIFFGYYHQVHAHSYYPQYLIRNSEKIPLEGNTGDYHQGKTFSHELIFEEGMQFIRNNKDQPFFAYFPWTPPHGLWMMPEEHPSWSKFKDKNWDGKNQRGEKEAEYYAAMIDMVDRQVGEVVSLLKELEIDENTIIFLCGDNGGQPYFKNEKYPHGFFGPNLNPKTKERFRGGKGDFYEGGLRIPFMVRWPGKIQEGRISDHLGYFPDILPTLADIAGTEPIEDLDGISILPTLLGQGEADQRSHDYLYWEGRGGTAAVRMQNWKMVRPNDSVSYELYNLSDDIQELTDVSVIYPEILQQMKEYALKSHTETQMGVILDESAGFKGHKAEK